MSILITESPKKNGKNEITRIVCPDCGEKLRGVGLEKDSKIQGLVFRCKRCGAYKCVTTE